VERFIFVYVNPVFFCDQNYFQFQKTSSYFSRNVYSKYLYGYLFLALGTLDELQQFYR